ncbi:MAG: hypothetical protein A2498_01725 [Lentisphaerae bacterium RIFOXYC12_FULL_60_16]|nr:MAG: hypothetical protein A2498_01725 [Lentisphaerae bacterium RIFOXYC12_FULL_60_16]
MRRWMTTVCAICRMDQRMASTLVAADGRSIGRVLVVVVTGGMFYGFVFGIWRSPLQALYSAGKMPLLFLSVVGASAGINTILARVAGCDLRLAQVFLCMVTAFAITAAVAASLAPVAALFVACMPGPRSDPGLAEQAYYRLLLLHVGVIAFAGLLGNWRALRLLEIMAGQKHRARRVGLAWLATAGFVGCQLSWLFSPFLCKPTQEPHLLPKEYFQENFYERVWHSAVKVAAR